jgi:hypothetical protein
MLFHEIVFSRAYSEQGKVSDQSFFSDQSHRGKVRWLGVWILGILHSWLFYFKSMRFLISQYLFVFVMLEVSIVPRTEL